MDIAPSDIRSEGASIGASWHGPKLLKRILCSSLVITNVYGIFFMSIGLWLVARHDDVGIENNPISNPPVITALVATFIALIILLVPAALFVVLRNCFYRCKIPNRSRSEKIYSTARFACLLALTMWPVCFLAVTGKVGMFNCVYGFSGFAKGGFCICDPRSLLQVDGDPIYLVGAAALQGVKIAFIGDTDDANVELIYDLIRSEGQVSAVVLNGDLDYKQEHQAWKERFERYLGKTPFYVTAGNHDTWTWRDYQEKTREHYTFSNVTECRGTIGVREECTHRGIGLLLSGAGSSCGGNHPEHTPFFTSTLQRFEANNVTWRICIFHKQQNLMQVGNKKDAVGWDKYEACLRHGAIIFNSHEHLYARTHELSNISENNVVVSRMVPKGSPAAEALQVGRGKSLVVLNGMGGGESRSCRKERVSDPWWAANWGGADRNLILQGVDGFGAGTPEPTHGVFFCTFGVNGDSRLANCYMRDIKGRLVDDFYVNSVN